MRSFRSSPYKSEERNTRGVGTRRFSNVPDFLNKQKMRKPSEVRYIEVPASTNPACSKVIIYIDAMHRDSSGGWAAMLICGQHRKRLSGSVLHQTTNFRMELQAAIEAFKALKKPTSVTVITQSQYVQLGASTWLKSWKAEDWCKDNIRSKTIKNKDLWQELSSLMEGHNVFWKWDPLGTADANQDEVHAYARKALNLAYHKPIIAPVEDQ